ncbi:DNA cytosine methyltransferase [Vibrio harveyi]
MRIVDLFCGLGGLTIGALEATRELNLDFEIYLASDFEDSCAEFYQHNFSGYLRNFHAQDLTMLDVKTLESPTIDFLFAGPPCQGHSDLNNKSRRNDPRNSLYLETIHFINHLNPRFFVIENVPSVVHSKEKVVTSLKKQLCNNYQVTELVIDFQKLGIAQTRKRHILLGSPFELPDNFSELLYQNKSQRVLRDVIGDIENISSTNIFDTPSRMSRTNTQRADYLYDNNLFDLPNDLRPRCHQGKHSYKSMYGRLAWDKPSQTITGGFGSMGQGRFLHPSRRSVISPFEAARIQGLPDWLDFSQTNRRNKLHQMIGNAVPPILSKELIITLESLNETRAND